MAVEFEEIRSKLDGSFRALVADLNESYYQSWKNNKSNPWLGCDYYPNDPDKSKIYFDFLHGFVFHLHAILLENVNVRDAIYDRLEKDHMGRTSRNARKAERLTSASDAASAWIPEATAEVAALGLNPINWRVIRGRVKTRLMALSGREIDI